MIEVKNDIREACPMNLKQVIGFLDNYSCTMNTEIDEDTELAFINTQRKLVNTSEQTVYVVGR